MHSPFVCPVCREPLEKLDRSLQCENRHTYDIARQGYVNLLRKKPDNLYEDKELFLSRRAVYAAGFFAPVVEAVGREALSGLVLDAGCGEGSLLAAVAAGAGMRGVGLDIARPAVQMAAATFKDMAWCVGDLCDIPLDDGRVDTILNMLTPANYAEFGRVMRPEGRLIKVVPGAAHLHEIRDALGKAPYTHETADTVKILEKQFTLLRQEPVRYTVDCDENLASNVFRMTPLTAHEALSGKLPNKVTVDVTILVAQK